MQKQSIVSIFGVLVLLIFSCTSQEQRDYDALGEKLEGDWKVTKIITIDSLIIDNPDYILSIDRCDPNKDDSDCYGEISFKSGNPNSLLYSIYIGDVTTITPQFVAPSIAVNPDSFNLIGKTYLITELTDTKMRWERNTNIKSLPSIEFEFLF
jgi:hypothetical protein